MFQNELQRTFKKFDTRLRRKQDQLKMIASLVNKKKEKDNIWSQSLVEDGTPINVHEWVDKLDLSI